ncbi:hypothetical protein QT383_19715 [Stenotrophomonas rhizophila]
MADSATSPSAAGCRGTCTLTDARIDLDPVSQRPHPRHGQPDQAGALEFNGCVGVSKAVLSFAGTAADGDATRWKNTETTDPAGGVSISLLSGTTGSTYLKDGDTGIDVPVTGTSALTQERRTTCLPQACPKRWGFHGDRERTR